MQTFFLLPRADNKIPCDFSQVYYHYLYLYSEIFPLYMRSFKFYFTKHKLFTIIFNKFCRYTYGMHYVLLHNLLYFFGIKRYSLN